MSEDHSQGRHQHSTTTGQITNRASGQSPLPSRHQDEDGSKANSQPRHQQVSREPNSRKKPGGPSCEATTPRRHGRPEAETQRHTAPRPDPHPRHHGRPGGSRRDAHHEHQIRRWLFDMSFFHLPPSPSPPALGASRERRGGRPDGSSARQPAKLQHTTESNNYS
jgi:hypothetical protein